MSYKLLKIDTSIRSHSESYSSRMGDYAIEKIRKKFPGSEVEYIDLYQEPVTFLNAVWDAAAHTPLELRSEEQNEMLEKISMKPLVDSDIYICCLAGYMYDMPATFKSFLEHMVQYDITVNPDGSPQLKDKKVLVIAAWGDDYNSVTPEIGYEFAVKKSFEILGIKDIKFFNIFNTDEITATEDSVQEQIDKYISEMS